MKSLIAQYPRSAAWLVFFGGLAVLLVIDRLDRMRDGRVQDGGLPEVIYYGVPVLLSVVSVYCLSYAVRKYQKVYLGVLEALAHLVVGAAVYCLAVLVYVVGTGIDSL